MSTINSANIQVGQSNTSANNITLSTSAGGDLVVSKGVAGSLTEISRITNGGLMDAAKVGYLPAGTGAVATTVQSELRKSIHITDYCIADGVTNDTTAFGNLITQVVANGGGNIYLDGKTVYLAAGVVDFSALSNVTFIGPGGFAGPAIASGGVATLGIKVFGSLGSAYSQGAIAKGAKSFFASGNTFIAGQMVLLSNFPTDATDAYTSGGTDIFGNVVRNYANTSSGNLRQTRRKEILEVKAAGSTFTTSWGTTNYYSSATTQFQALTMPTNLTFNNVTFSNLLFYGWYANKIVFSNCNGSGASINMETCINCKVDFSNLDFKQTDARVDFFGASRSFQITGQYKNNNTPSDNGMVKATGCTDYIVDIVCMGGTGVTHGFQADTNFSNDYRGYTDLVNTNYRIKVAAKDMSGGSAVAITTDPYAVAYAGEVTNGIGTVEATSEDAGVSLNGCALVDVRGAIGFQDGSNNSIFLSGTTSCGIYATTKGGTYATGVCTNGRGGQVQQNTDVRGVWVLWPVSPKLAGSVTAGTNTYATAQGYYLRNGNNVRVKGYIACSAINSVAMAGNLVISNLPFTSFGGSGAYADATVGYYGGISFTGGAVQIGGYVSPSSTRIDLTQGGSGLAPSGIPVSGASATMQLMFGAEYQI
jgi:hypothetical protein